MTHYFTEWELGYVEPCKGEFRMGISWSNMQTADILLPLLKHNPVYRYLDPFCCGD